MPFQGKINIQKYHRPDGKGLIFIFRCYVGNNLFQAGNLGILTPHEGQKEEKHFRGLGGERVRRSLRGPRRSVGGDTSEYGGYAQMNYNRPYVARCDLCFGPRGAMEGYT